MTEYYKFKSHVDGRLTPDGLKPEDYFDGRGGYVSFDCDPEELRKVVHRCCDDIIRAITKKRPTFTIDPTDAG